MFLHWTIIFNSYVSIISIEENKDPHHVSVSRGLPVKPEHLCRDPSLCRPWMRLGRSNCDSFSDSSSLWVWAWSSVCLPALSNNKEHSSICRKCHWDNTDSLLYHPHCYAWSDCEDRVVPRADRRGNFTNENTGVMNVKRTD